MLSLAHNRIVSIAIFLTWLAIAMPAFGIIVHSDSGQPTDRPGDSVMGRWGSNASCVAIAPDLVITTRHQGGGRNTSVEIGGKSYAVQQVYDHATADLRIVKLAGADLTDFVDIYNVKKEIGSDFVIGGFGNGRGAELQKAGQPYGYKWDNTGNNTLRWGTNNVDGVSSMAFDLIKADFDALAAAGATAFESAIANHDSGGGWFIKVDGRWKLAGLSHGVAKSGSSTFDKLNTMTAVRLSSYTDWIHTGRQTMSLAPLPIVPEPATVLLVASGALLLARRSKK